VEKHGSRHFCQVTNANMTWSRERQKPLDTVPENTWSCVALLLGNHHLSLIPSQHQPDPDWDSLPNAGHTLSKIPLSSWHRQTGKHGTGSQFTPYNVKGHYEDRWQHANEVINHIGHRTAPMLTLFILTTVLWSCGLWKNRHKYWGMKGLMSESHFEIV
jgi:hypothetical protein